MKLIQQSTRLLLFAVACSAPCGAIAGGPRCPAGYELSHDDYWDVDFCHPPGSGYDSEDRDSVDASNYWAAVYVNIADGSLHGVQDARSDKAAQATVIKACKQDMKAKKMKGKCEYVTSWANDYAAFVTSADRLYFEFGTSASWARDQALKACRAASTDCKVALEIDSEGY